MDILNELLAIDLNYLTIALIAIFYTLEQILTTQFKFDNMRQHLLTNVLFLVIISLGNIMLAIGTVSSIEWLNSHQIGLLYLFELPIWLKLMISLMCFDFVNYCFHRIAHVVPFLWRFHRVHHSDPKVDACSTLRAHPLEILLYFGASSITAAAIFGLDLLSLGFFFLIITPYLFLEHSNIRFPGWLDKSVGLIFTTPNMHKIHHEQDQNYTDSNFADIFIIWDRLFGTFKYKPVAQIKFGLQEFEGIEKQTCWFLLKSPFMDLKRVTPEELSVIQKKKNKWV